MLHYECRLPVPLLVCHGISPNFCREGFVLPAAANLAVELPPTLPMAGGIAEASEADRLIILFGAIKDTPTLGESEPLDPPLPFPLAAAGFRPGFKEGTISLASSLTSTAPSPPPWLRLSTTPSSPYFSTSMARFGCTSHTVLRIRSRLSRTTALLLCASRSIIRLKKAEDFVIAIVTGVDRRVILRKGSSRFSKEFALAATKHCSKALIDSGFTSSSSTREVSSCNLQKS